VYPHKGKFYALDRNLDLKTGSIRYYVTFPNPGNILRPRQFGKVRFVADMKKGSCNGTAVSILMIITTGLDSTTHGWQKIVGMFLF